jgi:hypothetical protein
MNFSDCIEHTSGIVEYSHDGKFVAISRAFDVYVSVFQTNFNYVRAIRFSKQKLLGRSNNSNSQTWSLRSNGQATQT